MKIKSFALLAVITLFGLSACTSNNSTAVNVNLDDETQKLSYSMGVSIGNSIKSQGVTKVDSAALGKALDDVFSDKTPLLSLTDAEAFLNTYFQTLRSSSSEANSAESTAFLEANRAQPGVITTETGLQYMVVTEGTGAMPVDTDTVTVNYEGKLINGTVFDSSIERQSPASFQVNQVIPGWTEALKMMKVGSKWKLYIPSELAYGDQGAGSLIGPGQALVFDVELLSIDTVAP